MSLSDIPRPLLVGLVLVLGVLSFFFIQKPLTVCDAQIDILKDHQAGFIFAAQGRRFSRPALVEKQYELCRQGNSSGSCYEFYSTIRSLVADLGTVPSECGPELKELGGVWGALKMAAETMVSQAWGEDPPGAGQFGWFQASDLNLFCGIRDQWVRFKGMDSWESFRFGMYSKLPGEPRRWSKDGKCLNCKEGERKPADQIFGPNDLWVRSLFAANCERYR